MPVGHVDLDAFFAAVAEIDHPELVGHPVAVGGRGPHGVVATANYVARGSGVHSAQRTSEARRLCPELTVVEPDFQRYQELSLATWAVMARFASELEPASIDEAYVRFFGEGWDDVAEVAQKVKASVTAETGLVISVGVGISRGVAKLASGAGKPNGLVIVRPQETVNFLSGRALGDLGGAGEKTRERLGELGIHSVTQLAALSAKDAEVMGAATVDLWRRARGEDSSEVGTRGVQLSVGAEHTLDEPVTSREAFGRAVASVAREATVRAARLGMAASGVTIKVRTTNWRDLTRSKNLGAATNDTAVVASGLRPLVDEAWAAAGGPVRLVGVSLTGLTEVAQPRLVGTGTEWALGRAPSAGEVVHHETLGDGVVVVGTPEAAVVRFKDAVRVISDPRSWLTVKR